MARAGCELVVLLVLTTSVLAPAARAAVDAHGDLEPRSREVPAPSPAPDHEARPKGVYRVGLDDRHGFDADTFAGTGRDREELRALLEAHGATLVPLSSFDAASLAGLDAVYIAQPFSQNASGFSTVEQDAIHAFVAAGHPMMLNAEAGWGSNGGMTDMNALAAPYGVTFDGAETDGSGHLVTSFVAHSVTAGLGSVGVDYQRRLVTIRPPALDLTTLGRADDILAVVDHDVDQGCVVLVSDPSCWGDADTGSDYPLASQDNAVLLGNIIDWFMSADCQPSPCGATAAMSGPDVLCEGEPFTYDASASTIPACAGAIEFRWLENGTEVLPFPGGATWSGTARADAVYTVEIRCDADPFCGASADHALSVVPDVPPPTVPNLLRADKQPSGILFSWSDTGTFTHHLRRQAALPFDRPTSALVADDSGTSVLVAGELTRPPWLLFYQLVDANCAGTEEP